MLRIVARGIFCLFALTSIIGGAMPVDSSTFGWHVVSPVVDLGTPWKLAAVGNGAYILNNGFIAHSADGGATWTRFDLPGCFTVRDAAFANDSLGLVVGDAGLVLKTTDGGVTWKQKPTNFTSVDIRFVTFASPTIAYASGNFGLVLKSVDAGETWTYPSYGDLFQPRTFAYVRPISPTHVWLFRLTRVAIPNAALGFIDQD